VQQERCRFTTLGKNASEASGPALFIADVGHTGSVPDVPSGRRKRRSLAALDHVVLDRRWSNRWLFAASIIGLALAVLGAVGYFVGGGAGTTQIPFGAGACVAGLALSEIWSRRQQARGREAFGWLRRLDDRVVYRKR
jgi:hypothetical protein